MSLMQRILVVLITVIIIAIGTSGYLYFQYQKTQKEIQSLKADPTGTQQLVQEVGALAALPTNEQPTIATVTDVDKLKDQSFFADAKNGYKVLIYPSNKKAILYDPIAKKIIDIAPLNIGSDSSQLVKATTSDSGTTKVALRNGTSTVGMTTKFEPTIKDLDPKIEITSKENAEKRDYDRTIIILLNDKSKAIADKIAKELKASIESLPAGEETPTNTDILVILGKK